MGFIQDLSNSINPVINDEKAELMLEQFYALLATRLMDKPLLLELSKQLALIENDEQLLLFITHIWQDIQDREIIINELSASYHLDAVLVEQYIAKASPFVYKEVVEQAKKSALPETIFLQEAFAQIADLLPTWTDRVIPKEILAYAQTGLVSNMQPDMLSLSNESFNMDSGITSQDMSNPNEKVETTEPSLESSINNSNNTIDDINKEANNIVNTTTDISDSLTSNNTDVVHANLNNVNDAVNTHKPINIHKPINTHNPVNTNNITIEKTPVSPNNDFGNHSIQAEADTNFPDLSPSYRQEPKRNGNILKVVLPIFALVAVAGAGSLYWLAQSAEKPKQQVIDKVVEKNQNVLPTAEVNQPPIQPAQTANQRKNTQSVEGTISIDGSVNVQGVDNNMNNMNNMNNGNQQTVSQAPLNTETYIFKPANPTPKKIEDIDEALFDEVLVDGMTTNRTITQKPKAQEPVMQSPNLAESRFQDSQNEILMPNMDNESIKNRRPVLDDEMPNEMPNELDDIEEINLHNAT